MTELYDKQAEAFDYMVKTTLDHSAAKSLEPKAASAVSPDVEQEVKNEVENKEVPPNDSLKQIIIDNFYKLNLSTYWWWDDEDAVSFCLLYNLHFPIMSYLF